MTMDRWCGWLLAMLLAAMPSPAPAQAATAQLQKGAGAHRLIVLGEMHGTREVPAQVARLAAAYAVDGPVVVALELSRAEQAAVDTYLDSDGGHDAHGALLAGGYWFKPVAESDGRRNVAVLGLIESMRQLRAGGRDVAVLMFDVAVSDDPQARDRAMAAHIRRAFQALPRGRMLVVTGNVHAMRFKPDYCAQCQTPMTSYLEDLSPWSVDVQALAGEFVACTADGCAAMQVRTFPGHAAGHGPMPAGAPYDAWLRMPSFSIADPVSQDR